ncbi:MAG: acetylglutamate kinase [Gemmatimonadaceae bacterium]|nr:acetylglutamate kinase [Gemmatimonadaceae bacterium]
MSAQRRRTDAFPTTLVPRTDHVPHVASHVAPDVLIRVVKIGGRAQGDPSLAHRLREAASGGATRLVVVHGGGDEVSALQRQLGGEPTFVNGRRVTRARELDAVRMVLSGTVNKRLVAQLTVAGVRAVGISGEDGGLLTARVTDPDLGRVGGEVYSDATLVADLLNAGWVPVISPLARDREQATGEGLNVNGDDAAAAIAASLGADELLFLADVPGVLDGGRTVRTLDPVGISDLVARGVAQGGMRAKLEAATAALSNGVRRVRIADLAGVTDASAGTAVSLAPSPSKETA